MVYGWVTDHYKSCNSYVVVFILSYILYYILYYTILFITITSITIEKRIIGYRKK